MLEVGPAPEDVVFHDEDGHEVRPELAIDFRKLALNEALRAALTETEHALAGAYESGTLVESRVASAKGDAGARSFPATFACVTADFALGCGAGAPVGVWAFGIGAVPSCVLGGAGSLVAGLIYQQYAVCG